MVGRLGRILGSALITAANALSESSERNRVQTAEQEEAARWERRRQALFDMVDRALMVNHSQQHISNITKARTAARLRAEAADHCYKRSEALMQYTERQAANFEMFGTV